MKKYYCSIPVPDKHLGKRIREFGAKRQGAGSSAPHITIVPPREVPDDFRTKELIDAVTLALATIRSFHVTVTGVGFFGEKETIYASVDRSVSLIRCHEAAKAAFDRIIGPDKGEFADMPTPHITLATRLSPLLGEEAWAEANRDDWRGSFPCQKLYLLGKGWMNPEGQEEKEWTVIAFIRLG